MKILSQTMTSSMRVFVVSLLDATSRRTAMSNHLSKMNISFEFFDAIRGSALNREEREQLNPAGNLSSGAIGCYLSHIEIYKLMVRDQVPVAMILEDDAVLMPEVKKIVEEGCVNLAFDYCFLGCDDQGDQGFVFIDVQKTKNLLPGVPMGQLSAGPYCTHGYLITLAGAKKRLDCAYPLRTPIDHYGYLPYQPNIWATVPLLAFVNEHGAAGSMSSLNWSGIQTWSRSYWWYYPLRDVLRLRWAKKWLAARERSVRESRLWRPLASSFKIPPPWRLWHGDRS